MILGMSWLAMINPDIDWVKRTFKWREYTAIVALTTFCRVNVIEPEKFAKLALDKNANRLVIHARQVLNAKYESVVHRDRRDRIVQARSAAGTVKLSPEYNEYSDVFSDSGAAELPKHWSADHAIDLIDGKQSSYDLIYNLNEVKLETLRGYIESNLANDFIRPSTSPARSSILFVRKSGESLRLCVDYRGLNMIAIKNRYSLSLVEGFIDRLIMIKRYT